MASTSYEAQMILAYQALKRDPKLSIYIAATLYGVDRKTLGRRKHGIASQRDYTPKSRKLINLEESTII